MCHIIILCSPLELLFVSHPFVLQSLLFIFSSIFANLFSILPSNVIKSLLTDLILPLPFLYSFQIFPTTFTEYFTEIFHVLFQFYLLLNLYPANLPYFLVSLISLFRKIHWSVLLRNNSNS